MVKRAYLIALLTLLSCGVWAERHDIHAEADRPGMGTGTNILDLGRIQWETGFEVGHLLGVHEIVLPTILFRFGLNPWVELRLEYTGILAVDDKLHEHNDIPNAIYDPEPLWIGSKIRLWQGSDEPAIRWIPRTSLLLNLGLPLTTYDAKHYPISGAIDLLFENDITDWLTIGYDVGVDWIDWTPTPDIFASLAFNFMPTEKLGVFVESYNLFDPDATRDTDPTRTYTVCDINLDFGLTYMIHPRVQLDAYAGFNLYHSESFLSSPRNYAFLGFGVTWLLHHIGR
ncbi:MAG: transporter [Paludibacteraceae bacterium]|nr:transporter [Paludibacteraceae bacterium]